MFKKFCGMWYDINDFITTMMLFVVCLAFFLFCVAFIICMVTGDIYNPSYIIEDINNNLVLYTTRNPGWDRNPTVLDMKTGKTYTLYTTFSVRKITDAELEEFNLLK